MTGVTPEDVRWLDAAVRYATPFLGTTGDRPTVAALIVDSRSETIVARAVSGKGGRPHAEALAIAAGGFEAAGCTLYVTLEPCHHWDRTPPCVDAIVRAGIMRVVIGAADPEQRLSGGSVSMLESAGIETLLADHAPSLALHAGHILRHTARRPFVTMALNAAIDGMPGGSAKSGSAAAQWLDMLRARSDAILVGAATARAHQPNVTVTLPGLAQRTPLRVVLAGASGVDRQVNLIGGFSGHRTAIIAENEVVVDAPVSVEVMRVAGENGRPDLAAALAALADKGVQNLLVEPGQRLAAAMLEAGLVDRFMLASKVAGAGNELAGRLRQSGLAESGRQSLGDDELCVYERSDLRQ